MPTSRRGHKAREVPFGIFKQPATRAKPAPLGWTARFESRSFTFEAFAPTRERALELLDAGFKRHAQQYSRGDLLREREIYAYLTQYKDDISVFPMVEGAYRDGELIK